MGKVLQRMGRYLVSTYTRRLGCTVVVVEYVLGITQLGIVAYSIDVTLDHLAIGNIGLVPCHALGGTVIVMGLGRLTTVPVTTYLCIS